MNHNLKEIQFQELKGRRKGNRLLFTPDPRDIGDKKHNILYGNDE